jgi:hypothetical protein
VPPHTEDWISIEYQVSVETESAKLAILVTRLCCALDDRSGRAEDETKTQIQQIVASCPGVGVGGWM